MVTLVWIQLGYLDYTGLGLISLHQVNLNAV